MKIVLFSMLVALVFVIIPVYAVPPMERAPLYNLVIINHDDSKMLQSEEQVVIKADYGWNYPNQEYIVLFQITDGDGRVVMLNWIDGITESYSKDSPSYICGTETCYDEWAPPESYVCGDEICQDDYIRKKSIETSWIPKPGTYKITVYIWESLDNPKALSPPITIKNVTVTENTAL